MDLKKIIVGVMLLAIAVPMISSVGKSWDFNFNWILNTSSVYVSYPNQAFNQTLKIMAIDTNMYYFVNNSKSVARASIDDVEGIDPIFVYDNSSGRDMRVMLNITGSEALDKCQLYIKPQNSSAIVLTPGIDVPLGTPVNGTAYWVANKFLTTSDDCLQHLSVSQ